MYVEFSLPTGHDEPVFSIHLMTQEELRVLYTALKKQVQAKDFRSVSELKTAFEFIKKMEINKHLPSKQITAIPFDEVCADEYNTALRAMIQETIIKTNV